MGIFLKYVYIDHKSRAYIATCLRKNKLSLSYKRWYDCFVNALTEGLLYFSLHCCTFREIKVLKKGNEMDSITEFLYPCVQCIIEECSWTE